MKKPPPLSLKRILIVLTGFLLMPLLMFSGDYIIESKNDYSDFEPRWIHDGKSFVFVRWHRQKGSSRNVMALHMGSADGSGERLLYSFEPGMHIYGLRFLKASHDEKTLFIRLTKHDSTYRYFLRDFLYAIPIEGKGEVRIWKLEKESPDDIILAYDDGTALVRKIGGKGQNSIVFTDFGQTVIYSEFTYPRESFCKSAVIFNGGRQALVLVSDDRPGKNDNKCYILSRDGQDNRVLFSLDRTLMSPLYIQENRTFVSTCMMNHEFFYIIDEQTGKVRQLADPSRSEKPIFDFTLTPQGEDIILPSRTALYFINIAGRGYRKLEYPVTPVPPAVQRESDGMLLFSDGKTLCSSDREGKNFRTLTRLSAKTRMESHRLYRWYRDLRETTFMCVCRVVLGESFCEAPGLHRD